VCPLKAARCSDIFYEETVYKLRGEAGRYLDEGVVIISITPCDSNITNYIYMRMVKDTILKYCRYRFGGG